MKKRYIIVPTILVAVVVIAGGFKPSATSTPQTKIVSIATPTEKNQVSVSAEEKMAETKQALKEIEATSSEIDSRLLQSTAELKVQERLLKRSNKSNLTSNLAESPQTNISSAATS